MEVNYASFTIWNIGFKDPPLYACHYASIWKVEMLKVTYIFKMSEWP